MKKTVKMNGDAALMVKYAIKLARTKSAEFSGMSDEDVLARLIEMGLNKKMEAHA